MSTVLLADVKTHLNLTVTTHDVELQAFIDAAEAAIGERVGPLAAVARTVRVSPHPKALRVPSPAASLTSVTDYAGNTVTLADLRLESDAGLIYYLDGRPFSGAWYDVVYAHGFSACPNDLKLAVKELVRALWGDSQRGPTRRPGTSASDAPANTLPSAGREFPYAVSRLLAPHMPQLVG